MACSLSHSSLATLCLAVSVLLYLLRCALACSICLASLSSLCAAAFVLRDCVWHALSCTMHLSSLCSLFAACSVCLDLQLLLCILPCITPVTAIIVRACFDCDRCTFSLLCYFCLVHSCTACMAACTDGHTARICAYTHDRQVHCMFTCLGHTVHGHRQTQQFTP